MNLKRLMRIKDGYEIVYVVEWATGHKGSAPWDKREFKSESEANAFLDELIRRYYWLDRNRRCRIVTKTVDNRTAQEKGLYNKAMGTVDRTINKGGSWGSFF